MNQVNEFVVTNDRATFQRHFSSKFANARPLLVATIEITRRCPLTCAHCYNNLPMGDKEARGIELSYKEHCGIIDQLVELGCMEVIYTGGEVFARSDFLDIYTYAKQQGLLVHIFTNATLITPRIADYLAGLPPFQIEVTMYGRTKETYEQLTGVQGSYDKFIQGIELLKERGLPIFLKSVAISINQHEMEDLKVFAANFNAQDDFKFDSTMMPRVDCSKSPLAVRLNPEEVLSLRLRDSQYLIKWAEHVVETRQWPRPPFGERELYNCGGGKVGLYINPQGLISLCSASHVDTFDLRQGTLAEGWQVFLHEVRSRKKQLLNKCLNCQLYAGCSMCPAKAELENGNSEKPVDFLCQTTHLTAYTAGIDVPQHGDCECCPGGKYYNQLQESVYRLKVTGEIASVRRSGLPVIRNSISASGCNNCH